MLHHRLKTTTYNHHKEVEKKLIPDLNEMQKDDYRLFLKANYVFQYYFNKAIQKTDIVKAEGWAKFKRNRLPLIIQDIENMQLSPVWLFEDPFLGWNDNELLGAAYVSEGSSLGGKVILKQIKGKAFFKEDVNGHFLRGYDQNLGQSWKGFLNLLNERDGPDSNDDIIKGAKNTFLIFGNIIDKNKLKKIVSTPNNPAAL